MSAALCLATYGASVSVAGPLLLRRCSDGGKAPRMAAAAWLAAAVSATTSLTASAALVAARAPKPWALIITASLAIFAIRWILAIVTTVRRDLHRRARHRISLRMVAQPDHGLGVWILDAMQPMAYAVPGRGGLIVLTRGACALLSRVQLSAVLAHERAHLAERHDLVTLLAKFCQQALPWLPLFNQTVAYVQLLMEMRADDAAARAHGAGAVASALSILGRHDIPMGAFAAGGATVALRVRRLNHTDRRRSRRIGIAVGAVGALAAFVGGPVLAALDILCLHMLSP